MSGDVEVRLRLFGRVGHRRQWRRWRRRTLRGAGQLDRVTGLGGNLGPCFGLAARGRGKPGLAASGRDAVGRNLADRRGIGAGAALFGPVGAQGIAVVVDGRAQAGHGRRRRLRLDARNRHRGRNGADAEGGDQQGRQTSHVRHSSRPRRRPMVNGVKTTMVNGALTRQNWRPGRTRFCPSRSPSARLPCYLSRRKAE